MFIINTLANSIAECIKINISNDITSPTHIDMILDKISQNPSMETYFVTMVIFDYLLKVILLDS